MASNEKDSPISLLETLSEIDGNLEYFAVAKDGTTYKCTPAQLKDFFVLKGETPVVHIPSAVLNLSNSSSSEDILNAFGGKETFMDICQSIVNKDTVCVVANIPEEPGMKLVYIPIMAMATYTDANNANFMMTIITETTFQLVVTVTDGVATHSSQVLNHIYEAPSDGNVYGRKNKDWVEVPEHLNLTSENLNDINGAGFATQKSPTDYTSPENNYPINENGALIFANANYGHSNQIYGSYLTNRWFARGGGNQQGVRTNWKEFAFTDDVLTKTNTSSFTPTGDYQPATKKYVDSYHYGKSLKIPNVETVLHPTSLQGQDAQSKIDELFGGTESFKAIVEDILTKHTRYYFHFDDNFTNCLELGCVNAWKSKLRTSYELHFIVVYNTKNINYTSRIGVIYNVDVNATKYYVAHLVQSDNLTTLTKKTAAEYDAIGSKDKETMYAITDA